MLFFLEMTQVVKVIPVNKNEFHYSPTHPFVQSCLFESYAEANLVNAIAILGETNGMSQNDIRQSIPLVLRMYKSNSVWSK